MTLTSRIEDIASCEKRITIEIPADEVQKERNTVLAEYRKLAALPGFRKGHAPAHLVEKRYASAIDDETRTTLVRKAATQALQDQKIRPVTSPRVEDVKYTPGLSMALSIIIETAPDFDIPDYSSIPMPEGTTDATEEEINNFLESLRTQAATYHDAPEATTATTEHTAVLDFRAEIDGVPLTNTAPNAESLASDTDFWLPLDNNNGFIPGFAEKIHGHKAGDTLEIPITFPDDFPHEQLRGKPATYFTTLKALKTRTLPTLDDAFARERGAKDIQDLRAQLANYISRQKQQDLQRARRNAVAKHLLDSVQFDLPESVVADYTREIVQDIVADNSRRGISNEELTRHKDTILGNATNSARDRLRLEFILARIAKQEKITVTPSEITQQVAALAEMYKQPRQKLLKTMMQNGGLDRLENDLLTQKTLQHLINLALGETPALSANNQVV